MATNIATVSNWSRNWRQKLSTKRKSRINKTIGYCSEWPNRELLLPAAEDDDFDDIEDSLDCVDQPASVTLDRVNQLLSEAAYDPHASDAALEDDGTVRAQRAEAELTRLERDPT
jgi:hypothetical protein